MEIFRPQLRTAKENQHVVIITNGYSKLARAVSAARVATTDTEIILLKNWIFPYVVPSYVILEKGAQFVSKYLVTFGAHLLRKHLIRTAFHPLTYGNDERYSKAIVAHLCCYVAGNIYG